MQLENMTYRQASEELEAILRQLEGNQLELEESLACYERGISMLRFLQARLTDAEQKITVLMGEVEPEGDDSVDVSLS